MKFKIAACAFLLLALSLGFNIMLTTASMEKVFTEAVVSEYKVVAGDLQRGIARALKFGKRLDKFTGIQRILDTTRDHIFQRVVVRHTPQGFERRMLDKNDIVISLARPDGSILYSTNDKLVGETLPGAILALFPGHGGTGGKGGEGGDEQPADFAAYGDDFHIALPVAAPSGGVAAYAVIGFGQAQVQRLLKPFFDYNLEITAAIMACGLTLLIVALSLLTYAAPLASGLPMRRISVSLFLVVGLAQVVFSGLNMRSFRDEFLAINQAKAETLMTLLQEDIEFFFKKGLKLENLRNLDDLLGDVISASPELRDIVVYDTDGKPIFVATQEATHDYRADGGDAEGPAVDPLMGDFDPRYRSHWPLMRKGTLHGHLVANVSRSHLMRKMTEIAKDSVTVLVISILFFVEMLILANLFLKEQSEHANGNGNKAPPEAVSSPQGGAGTVPFTAIRPAAFLFLFGIDMCISFLPLYMKKLYVPILGLSKEVVLGLPISVEMLFAGVGTLVSGTWIDRRGWHEPFWAGVAAATAGTAWSWLAPDALHFIAARGLVGLGFGLFIMSAQGFVVTQTEANKKAQGMAQMWAGVFAGSICGGAAGAMMAERVGYRPVLMAGMVIVALTAIYALLFLRRAMDAGAAQRRARAEAASQAPRLTLAKALAYLFDRDVFGLLVLAYIPGALAFVGFMYYFSPVYLSDVGASQSDIGRIYMLYGVCLIYIAPFISRFLDIADNQKFYVFLSGAVGCLGFTTYYFFGGLPATALTALLLGLSGSFDPTRAYVLKLKATHDLGEGTAMSLFNSVGRLGQVAGPMIFGWMLLQFGMPDAVTFFGVAYLAVIVLFSFCTRTEKQLAEKGLLHKPEK